MREFKDLRELKDHRTGSAANAALMIYVVGETETGWEVPHGYAMSYFDESHTRHTQDVIFHSGPVSAYAGPRVDTRLSAYVPAALNGVTDEALIAIVIDRLRGFQVGKMSCRENSIALTKLEEGLLWLAKRTWDRQGRGVEGTQEK